MVHATNNVIGSYFGGLTVVYAGTPECDSIVMFNPAVSAAATLAITVNFCPLTKYL